MTTRRQRILQVLLHVEDTPHRTALAFAIGVMVAFSPFLGIHMGIALLIAFLFRFNRVAVLLGTYVNNPWTVAPMYLAGTTLGCFLLGVSTEGLGGIDWDLHGWELLNNLLVTLRPYLWPFVLGNTILGLVFGAAAYVVLRRFIEARGRRSEAAGQAG